MYECANEAGEEFVRDNKAALCNCPRQCRHLSYTHDTSQAIVSNHMVMSAKAHHQYSGTLDEIRYDYCSLEVNHSASFNDIVTYQVGHLSNLVLECGPMPNVMAAQPNVGGAVCEISVISFLVPRLKVWLTLTGRVPCSNAANIGERKTWTQSDVCTWQNSARGQKPPKNVYIVYQPRRRHSCEVRRN